MGWVQELVSRLTHSMCPFYPGDEPTKGEARLTEFDTSTNSSLHNDVHFPLNDPM